MPGSRERRADAPLPPASARAFEPLHWTRRFRTVIPRTRFVSLPPRFVAALLDGGVYAADPAPQLSVQWSDGTVDDVQSDEAAVGDADGRAEVAATIDAVIAQLGGEVSPKVGSRCPLDATWITFHRSTKCASAEEVLTLVKSSERVIEALTAGSEAVLALRQWADIDQRMEFRCFVRDDVLVGVCQRTSDTSIEYDDADMDRVVDTLSRWFERHVRDVFDGPARYTMDVYIDRSWRTWLFDFSAWGHPTDALLFEWEDLESARWLDIQSRAQFRCAYLHAAIRPAPEMYCGLPIELRNSEAVASLTDAARRLMEQQNAQSPEDEEDASSESEHENSR